MNMIRHVAKLANTDQRCVVAFMQIPGREDHALVIPTDNLPPRMEQAVMDVLKSHDGQQEETLGVVLARHLLPDTGQNILEALHSQNRLAPVPVQQVVMMPTPNRPVPLSSILESLGRLPDQQTQGLMAEYATQKFNPHANNQTAATNENSRAIASNLIIEAQFLETDAREKRERAYKLDPTLRPAPMQAMSLPSHPIERQPTILTETKPVEQPKRRRNGKGAV